MVQTPGRCLAVPARSGASVPTLGVRGFVGFPPPIRGDQMKTQSCSWAAAAGLALVLALSGCTFGEPAAGDTPSKAERKQDRAQKKAKKQKAQAKKGQAKKAATPKPKPKPEQVWVCRWSPTFDEDWHNDVLCENGIASERPRLREWDGHVERWEIMESAKQYARERNAG